jgi:hypothetical protein
MPRINGYSNFSDQMANSTFDESKITDFGKILRAHTNYTMLKFL